MDWTKQPVTVHERGLSIGASSVVERWEYPIQEALADAVCISPLLRIVEIGYGLGMATRQIRRSRPSCHWIIEAHPIIADHARQQVADAEDAVVITGLWEFVLPMLRDSSFDGIVFDGYPCDGSCFDGSTESTFRQIARLLNDAWRLLAPGGRLGFLDFSLHVHLALKSEIVSLFSSLTTVEVPLTIPEGCTYAAGSTGHVVVMQK